MTDAEFEGAKRMLRLEYRSRVCAMELQRFGDAVDDLVALLTEALLEEEARRLAREERRARPHWTAALRRASRRRRIQRARRAGARLEARDLTE